MKLGGRIRNQGKVLAESLPETAKAAMTELVNALAKLAKKVAVLEKRAAAQKAKLRKVKKLRARKLKAKKRKAKATARGKANMSKQAIAERQAKRAAARAAASK